MRPRRKCHVCGRRREINELFGFGRWWYVCEPCYAEYKRIVDYHAKQLEEWLNKGGHK